MKKILFINRQAPHASVCAQEALDVLLMASTFAQDISVLFMDEGIWQLQKDQDTQFPKAKDFALILEALPLYDIDNVYVAEESLKKYGIKEDDLLTPVELLTNDRVAKLMARQDHIVSF